MHFFSLIIVDVAVKSRLPEPSRERAAVALVQAHGSGFRLSCNQTKPAHRGDKVVPGTKDASTTRPANHLDVKKKKNNKIVIVPIRLAPCGQCCSPAVD